MNISGIERLTVNDAVGATMSNRIVMHNFARGNGIYSVVKRYVFVIHFISGMDRDEKLIGFDTSLNLVEYNGE